MQSQLKAKQKLEIQRSVTQLSNVLSSQSPVRQLVEQQLQYLSSDHMQTIHSNIQIMQKLKRILNLMIENLFVLSSIGIKNPLTLTVHLTLIIIIPQLMRIIFTLLLFQEICNKKEIYYLNSMEDCTMDSKTAFPIFMYIKLKMVQILYFVQKKVSNVLILEYNDKEMQGVWSSTNICQIRGDPTKSVTYKLQTSVLYQLKIKSGNQQNYVKMSGSMKKNKVEAKKLMPQYEIDEFHLMVCGKLIQQNQTLLRQQLQSILAVKSKQICFKNRYNQSRQAQQMRIKMGKEFVKLRSQSSKIIQ